jgi:hypothetical protein
VDATGKLTAPNIREAGDGPDETIVNGPSVMRLYSNSASNLDESRNSKCLI